MIYYGWQGKFITDENTNNNKYAGERYIQKNPRSSEEPRGNTPVGDEGFEPPTLCL